MSAMALAHASSDCRVAGLHVQVSAAERGRRAAHAKRPTIDGVVAGESVGRPSVSVPPLTVRDWRQ